MALIVLPRSFYSRSTLEVAPQLLGKILSKREKGETLSGRIIEVEAYLGSRDPASHAFRGPTRRNQAMFGPPGHAYVYFTYGAHFCFNVVTEPKGVPGAVLIRAVEPLEGIHLMSQRRKQRPIQELASGPGKLTQAFGITLADNGRDLFGPSLWIGERKKDPSPSWRAMPRVGIRCGVKLRYRFVVSGSLLVSRR